MANNKCERNAGREARIWNERERESTSNRQVSARFFSLHFCFHFRKWDLKIEKCGEKIHSKGDNNRITNWKRKQFKFVETNGGKKIHPVKHAGRNIRLRRQAAPAAVQEEKLNNRICLKVISPNLLTEWIPIRRIYLDLEPVVCVCMRCMSKQTTFTVMNNFLLTAPRVP